MKHKPGEKVPQSGIYGEYNMYGSLVTEVTCVKNEVFPPTEGKDYHYKLIRAAKHKIAGG